MQHERMMRSLWTMLLAGTSTLSAQSVAREVAIDVPASRIFVVTHRTGLLSFLGHQHVIMAGQWSARVCWSATSPAASQAQFTIAARTLTIDADSARRLAGLGGGPSPRQREQIQRTMLDAEHLDVASHPELTFRSAHVTQAGDTLSVHGRLTIKGITREVVLPVTLQQTDAGAIRMSGRLSVRQSAFDIRPESIAGVVKVGDTVDIHVRLAGTLTTDVCVAT